MWSLLKGGPHQISCGQQEAELQGIHKNNAKIFKFFKRAETHA